MNPYINNSQTLLIAAMSRENATTPTKDSKRRLEFSPLTKSKSEDNILYPLAKRPNKKSFIEMLDAVSDDDPKTLKVGLESVVFIAKRSNALIHHSLFQHDFPFP